MLDKRDYNPEEQFLCYLCERIKDKADNTPTFFMVGGFQYLGCPDCVGKLEKMRTYKKGERHPVIVDGSWKMITEE